MSKRSTKRVVDRQELERWKKRGAALKAAEERVRKTQSCHQWHIAEWMLEGVGTFRAFYKKRKASDRDKIAYKEGARVTGLTVETLRQFVHTARRVLIRVNGLSFGHHRLVASLKGRDRKERKERQAKALNHAKAKKLSVEKFAEYVNKLKGFNRADEGEEKTPTTADAAALSVMKRCEFLNQDLQELTSYSPPERYREELLVKLRRTADELNRTADELKYRWNEQDSLQAMMKNRAAAAAAGNQ